MDDGDHTPVHEEASDSLKPCTASMRCPDREPESLGKKSERFASCEEETSSCVGRQSLKFLERSGKILMSDLSRLLSLRTLSGSHTVLQVPWKLNSSFFFFWLCHYVDDPGHLRGHSHLFLVSLRKLLFMNNE